MKKNFIAILLMLLILLPIVAFAEDGEDDSIPTLGDKSEIVFKELNVTEIYVDRFEQYEQMMKNNLVFYTNIANGSFTQDSVVIELPANMTATMIKNGTEIPFVSGKVIQTPGAYVLTVYADRTASLELAENELYFSTFRFKIVEADAVSAVPEAENAAPPEDTDATLEDYLPTEDELTALEQLPTLNPSEQPPAVSAGSVRSPASTATNGSTLLLSQHYAANDNLFSYTSAYGGSFSANIPNGLMTTRPVLLTFTEALPVDAYLDDQPLDYILNTELTQPGNYRFVLREKATGVSPMFTFTILPAQVNGLGVYTPPAGFTISDVTLDGQRQAASDTQLFLERDGRYELTVQGQDFSLPVAFELDNNPPLARLGRIGSSGKGPVTVEILSDDTQSVTATLAGRPVNAEPLTFDDEGDYVVAVIDHAANSTKLVFTIQPKINGMSVVAILCCLGLVIAGIVYVCVIRRRLIVR